MSIRLGRLTGRAILPIVAIVSSILDRLATRDGRTLAARDGRTLARR